MLPREHAALQQAMTQAERELGRGARRGELWAHICQAYLNQSIAAPPPQRDDPRPPSVGDDRHLDEEAETTLASHEPVALRPLGEQ